MSYSGADRAKEAREALGKALAGLQKDANIPEDVLAVAQNIAAAVGALFEAERASSELDGKACVRNALGSLSQTLALLQDVRGEHQGILTATEVIARSMSSLYPLTTVPSKAPPPPSVPAPVQPIGRASQPNLGSPSQPNMAQPGLSHPNLAQPGVPRVSGAPVSSPSQAPWPAPAGGSAPRMPAAPISMEGRVKAEANIGATTESNFYVGFSGEVAEGGVFLATYETYPKGTALDLLVTLPGGFEIRVPGRVRFVRDPMDLSAEAEPGMGIQFESISAESRELVLRFIRKRPPMFYDD
jgi:uncharacterized protein (TIGR02266 family)